jgi:hypothetical protein
MAEEFDDVVRALQEEGARLDADRRTARSGGAT